MKTNPTTCSSGILNMPQNLRHSGKMTIGQGIYKNTRELDMNMKPK